MKRANSQEPKSETSHSCFAGEMTVNEEAPSGNTGRSKSAAMLGLALSFGASGVLFADSEATAAVGSFVTAKSSASSESPQLPSVLRDQLEQPPINGQQGSTVYHTVEHGDSLWHIAKEHQVEVQDIKVANRIAPDAPLQVGQVIKVPGDDTAQPTLVSLLPGIQNGSDEQQAQSPNLERLVAGIAADVDGDVIETLQPSNTTAADEPVIVATAELTGSVSLRSAGLVSHSDGFQADLQQLASHSNQIVVSNPVDTSQTESTDNDFQFEELQKHTAAVKAIDEVATTYSENITDTASVDYEVRPGDTVDNIASSLGTSSEELITVNELDDPNFIVAGDTLAVPDETNANITIAEAVDTSAQPSQELTASSSLSHLDGARLNRLQSTVENPIHASSTLKRLRGEQAAPLVESSDTEFVNVEDPYTASLLAEVSSAQQLNPPTQIDNNDIALRNPDSIGDNRAINPEFQESRLEARVGSNNEAKRAELLAAAPLDPSVYVSSPSPTTGQMVSPEMPILPSADEYLPEAPDYFNGYIWPTRGTLTSGYGWRWGRMHRGIDVAGPVGTPIVSAAPGVVEKAGWNSGGYGNLVEVRHADGSMTRYAHNSRIVVRPGQRVAQGQHIADMGSTGYSTGPHLHFEVHLPERGTVNPMAMLPGR